MTLRSPKRSSAAIRWLHQHTSAYVSIRQLTETFFSRHPVATSAYVSIRQHTSAYASSPKRSSAAIRWLHQHTSAYVSVRKLTETFFSRHPVAFCKLELLLQIPYQLQQQQQRQYLYFCACKASKLRT
jgi:hypothetical protein